MNIGSIGKIFTAPAQAIATVASGVEHAAESAASEVVKDVSAVAHSAEDALTGAADAVGGAFHDLADSIVAMLESEDTTLLEANGRPRPVSTQSSGEFQSA